VSNYDIVTSGGIWVQLRAAPYPEMRGRGTARIRRTDADCLGRGQRSLALSAFFRMPMMKDKRGKAKAKPRFPLFVPIAIGMPASC